MQGALRTLREGLPRSGRMLRRFLPLVRPHRGSLLLALLFGTIVAATEVLRPWPLQAVFDHVLMPRPGAPRPLGLPFERFEPGAVVVVAAILVLTISLLGGLAAYAQTVLLAGVGQRVVSRLRRDLFHHLMSLPPLFHGTRRLGDLLMRLTGDVVMLRELLVAGLVDAAAAGVTMAGTLAVMLWLEPRLTVITLSVVPVVALASAAWGGRIRRAVRKGRRTEGKVAARAGEALGAVAMLQAFGATSRIVEAFERDNRSSLRSGLKASRFEALLSRFLDALTAAGLGVTLAVGAWSVREGHLTPGGLLVFLAYQRSLFKPMRQLARLAARSAKSAACGERILEILETPSDVRDRPSASPCPELSGEICFEGVSVHYPRGDRALEGIDLLVPAGSTVVIRGESGAGKSTLVSLIPRLLDPTCGRVLLDGRDAREFSLETLRPHVAVVFQEAFIFGLTLRDNIALGRPDLDPASIAERIEEAARRADVLRFAERLPRGLDTVVGERGVQLSGGQRQRVALARAALRDAPILVLDEPFVHLDAASRGHVMAAIREVARDRTVLLVMHEDVPGLEPDLVVTLAAGRILSIRQIRVAEEVGS